MERSNNIMSLSPSPAKRLGVVEVASACKVCVRIAFAWIVDNLLGDVESLLLRRETV